MNKERKIGSTLVTGGVVGPILCGTVIVGTGLMTPGYSIRSDNISGLGTGAYGWLVNVNFVVFGLLTLAFAAGLQQTFRGNRGPGLGPLLLAISGGALVAEGLFPTDPSWVRHQTTHAAIHDLAFVTFDAALAFACFTLGRYFREDPGWRGYSSYSCLSGVLILAFFTVFIAGGDASPWKGVVERMLLAVMGLWVEVSAIRLRRLALSLEGTELAASGAERRTQAAHV